MILPQARDIFLRTRHARESRYTERMDEKDELILASGSPRRKELLARTGRPFRIIVSDADEIETADMPPTEVAMRNARAKALAIAAAAPANATVIGADTIFGKPADEADARRMLAELSGRTHQVITGVCLVRNGQTEAFAETTDVRFKDISAEDIAAYVATGEPLDKAGAYGIQGRGGAFVDSVDGDYDNVVGLPVARLERALDLEGGDEIDDGQHGE